MKFAREPYSQALVEEMKPLWTEHFAEVAKYKDIPLDPNIALYEQMDRLGTLIIFTVRQAERLAGYQIFMMSAHPHFQKSLQAVQDLLFISKAWRLGLAGLQFVKWCDYELAQAGVQIVYQHINSDRDIGALLHRADYVLHDIVYSKRLDGLKWDRQDPSPPHQL